MSDTPLHRFELAPRELPLQRARDELTLHLVELDDTFARRGIYGHQGRALPQRFLYLHPAAADSLLRLENAYPCVFFYSDVFRDANGSRNRRFKNRERRERQGRPPLFTGKLPGSSGHNYGLCTDHDVSGNLKRLGRHLGYMPSKEDYDLIWREYGWWCHRDGPDGDHARGHEDWHFNYFGDDPDRWLSHSQRKTSGGIEAKLQYMYGPFAMSEGDVSRGLTELGYHNIGNRIGQFQRDWTLSADGIAGPQTQRVLCYLLAEQRFRRSTRVNV
jgi:hypothetical protein